MSTLFFDGLLSGDKFIPEPVRRLDDIFCGCGDPSTTWEHIETVLCGFLSCRCPDELSGAEWITVYLLDHLGFIEHGVSVLGSWLTDDGLILLGFLLANGPRWDMGTWIGEDGVTRGRV